MSNGDAMVCLHVSCIEKHEPHEEVRFVQVCGQHLPDGSESAPTMILMARSAARAREAGVYFALVPAVATVRNAIRSSRSA